MWTLELVWWCRSTCWTADRNAHSCKLLGHSRPALLTPSVPVASMGAGHSRLSRALRSRQTVIIREKEGRGNDDSMVADIASGGRTVTVGVVPWTMPWAHLSCGQEKYARKMWFLVMCGTLGTVLGVFDFCHLGTVGVTREQWTLQSTCQYSTVTVSQLQFSTVRVRRGRSSFMCILLVMLMAFPAVRRLGCGEVLCPNRNVLHQSSDAAAAIKAASGRHLTHTSQSHTPFGPGPPGSSDALSPLPPTHHGKWKCDVYECGNYAQRLPATGPGLPGPDQPTHSAGVPAPSTTQ